MVEEYLDSDRVILSYEEKHRDANLRRKYNITLFDLREMISAQEGECANPGCETKVDEASCVDHNHKTGEVRAVLCSGCNSSLGFLYENKERIRGLVDYLDVYGSKHD